MSDIFYENSRIIGKRAKRNFGFLYSLLYTKSGKKRTPTSRWRILKNAKDEELAAIKDICWHVAKERYFLSKEDAESLEPFKDLMEMLIKEKKPEKIIKIIQTGEGLVENPNAKRKSNRLIVQEGGLPPLIPLLLTPILLDAAITLGKKGGKFLLKKFTNIMPDDETHETHDED